MQRLYLLKATEGLAYSWLRNGAFQASRGSAASAGHSQEDLHLGQGEGHLHLRRHNNCARQDSLGPCTLGLIAIASIATRNCMHHPTGLSKLPAGSEARCTGHKKEQAGKGLCMLFASGEQGNLTLLTYFTVWASQSSLTQQITAARGQLSAGRAGAAAEECHRQIASLSQYHCDMHASHIWACCICVSVR